MYPKMRKVVSVNLIFFLYNYCLFSSFNDSVEQTYLYVVVIVRSII